MTINPPTPSEHEQQWQLPATCQPHRVDFSWVVQHNPVSNEVALVVFDATGQRWTVMDNDTAVKIGEELVRAAGTARSGLVVP